MVEVVMVFHLRTTTISDPLKKLRRHLYTNIYTRLDIQKKTFLENLGKSSEQCVLWEGNELLVGIQNLCVGTKKISRVSQVWYWCQNCQRFLACLVTILKTFRPWWDISHIFDLLWSCIMMQKKSKSKYSWWNLVGAVPFFLISSYKLYMI